MQHINIITRRGFFDRSLKLGLGVALSTLTDIPFVLKRALAEGSIGLNKKKVLFIFLRGANDSLNSLIPIEDPAYATSRPKIGLPRSGAANYYSNTGSMDDLSGSAGFPSYAINAGNAFAALHPSLKYLAPVYNAGDLGIIHRVGYPRQSRSHFDSQIYWESGNPGDNLSKDGIFYRTILESGLANGNNPFTGVSIQSSLPLLLRGSEAAMTNLSDPTRFKLLGVPNSAAGVLKATNNLIAANNFPVPEKMSRELLSLQYKNLNEALEGLPAPLFDELNNTYTDPTTGYHLFPTSNAKNALGVAANYVVDTAGASYTFFKNIKAAALILNKTSAIIAGTELGGFDTHSSQIFNDPLSGAYNVLTGAHSDLQKRIAWAMYGLRKYFLQNPDQATWNDTIVVTLSEFGRTTIENGTFGTDHAEAGVMFVAGGGVKGYDSQTPGTTGIFGCNLVESHNGKSVPWIPGPANQAGGVDGSMFGVSDRYLRRAFDYRSVLGKIIRDHLGATQGQLDKIIPAYTVTNQFLKTGGQTSNTTTEKTDGTFIAGEPDIV